MHNLLMTSDFYTVTDTNMYSNGTDAQKAAAAAVARAAVNALARNGTTPDLVSEVTSAGVMIVIMKSGAFGTGGAAAAQATVRAAHADLADATVTIAASF